MKAHSDHLGVLATLKEAVKAKGFTYSRLARTIGVAEITIKRLFTYGQGASLDRIFEICDAIDVSFFDIAALARQEEEVDFFLTPEQETYFAARPAHFAILKQLNRGLSSEQIKKLWRLEETRLFKILRSFEKFGLLDLLPGNRVRMKIRGNIRMAHRGALAKKILRPQIIAFLDHVDLTLENKDVCMHSAEVELSPTHIKEFVAEIHGLGAKYRARAFRDRSLMPAKKLRSVRWLFCFAPFETDWFQYEV